MAASDHRGRVVAALAGLLFGLGLAIAGMTDPRKVLAFLDVAGAWDPSLMVVLAVAVSLTAWGYRRVLRGGAPRCAAAFDLPAERRVDARLLLGAALFGLGWGAAGYCPGPALAGLAMDNAQAWIFVPAMLAGSWLTRAWMDRAAARRASDAPRPPGRD